MAPFPSSLPSPVPNRSAELFGSYPSSMVGTVKVHNVSLKASDQDIREFFSFSGDIVHVEMQSGDERSQFAYITFRDNHGAERAMLLTGATIVDMAVIITPATDYQLPAAVLAELESRNTGGMESALRKAEDAVGSMLAKGFVLGMDALEKAKSFDEKHQLTSTATAKVSSLDKSMGLSQKFSTGTLVVNEKMKEMDEKYQVAEKTKSALAAAEQTVTTAGSAIMSNRYVLTGAAWVTGAYNKVATPATDVGVKAKERMVAQQEEEHQDGELAKTHLPESSEAAEQECKDQEGDSVKNFVLESPEMAQQESEHQEGGGQITDRPENIEMVKQDQRNQEGEIAISHVQENVEIAEKEPKHHETESLKAHISDILLIAEQTEQEHKHLDGEFAKDHVPGSPVTIPVTVATIDGNSSNTPEKPESAQGFV
ncbi:binding partner of ACD11 1-like isoform X2 [Phragmites australis]|uniref:binding partner of ACD11 1-like isoform X2 n=1 Tax=Phragmites australis TaxID=29695 RepID=UPI002D7A3D38|nr:binding partner of ACD11 1-like isoform X2 [Phragmites australis]